MKEEAKVINASRGIAHILKGKTMGTLGNCQITVDRFPIDELLWEPLISLRVRAVIPNGQNGDIIRRGDTPNFGTGDQKGKLS